jgi:hypothetical protein
LTAFIVVAIAAHGEAQPPDAAPPAPSAPLDEAPALDRGASEWMSTIGSAWGQVVFHSAGGHRYLSQTLSWGKVLSGAKFRGVLRGRFEWAVEVTPAYAQYDPDDVYGIGVSPFVWRWNFEPHRKYAPFAELAGGLLWTTKPVPQGTTGANFTAHAGVGLRRTFRPTQALVVLYRFDHISNGNRLDRNPGVNAHAIHVGWSVVKKP